MDPFELNSHGKIVFPSNCFPDLDFSTFENLEQLDAVVKRDFDSKAPTGTAILERIQSGGYRTKFELMRDMVFLRVGREVSPALLSLYPVCVA